MASSKATRGLPWAAARAFLQKDGYRYVEADISQKIIGNIVYDMMADESLFDEFVELLDNYIAPLG